MSDQSKSIVLNTEDLVRLIMSKHNIHNGFFILIPELMFTLGPHSVKDKKTGDTRDYAGISMITTAYRLQQVAEDHRGAFDAAKINPKKERATKSRQTPKDAK